MVKISYTVEVHTGESGMIKNGGISEVSAGGAKIYLSGAAARRGIRCQE